MIPRLAHRAGDRAAPGAAPARSSSRDERRSRRQRIAERDGVGLRGAGVGDVQRVGQRRARADGLGRRRHREAQIRVRRERRRVARAARRRRDRVVLRAAVRPGTEVPDVRKRPLRRGGLNGVHRSDDDGLRERGGLRRRGAHGQLQTCRGAQEVERGRLGVDADGGGVGQAVTVGRGELDVEVGRVLVVGGGEAAARHTRERLIRVRVAVGRAVLDEHRPRELHSPASVPSCGSVACPVNAMVSLTFQVSVESGVSMMAVGGAAPAVIVIGSADGGSAALVRDLEARRVGAAGGVDAGRLLRGRVVVLSVAVEVPGIRQRVAGLGGHGARAVEVDGQRARCPTSGWRWRPRPGRT